MKAVFFLFLLITLTACSSVRRQRSIGAVIGAIALGSIGASIGKELSPNPESEKLNKGLGMATGGALGLYLGAKTADYLWEDQALKCSKQDYAQPQRFAEHRW